MNGVAEASVTSKVTSVAVTVLFAMAKSRDWANKLVLVIKRRRMKR